MLTWRRTIKVRRLPVVIGNIITHYNIFARRNFNTASTRLANGVASDCRLTKKGKIKAVSFCIYHLIIGEGQSTYVARPNPSPTKVPPTAYASEGVIKGTKINLIRHGKRIQANSNEICVNYKVCSIAIVFATTKIYTLELIGSNMSSNEAIADVLHRPRNYTGFNDFS